MNRAGRRSGKPPRARTQMALGMGIFGFITLTMLWVFQIFLLRPFYKAIKTACWVADTRRRLHQAPRAALSCYMP